MTQLSPAQLAARIQAPSSMAGASATPTSAPSGPQQRGAGDRKSKPQARSASPAAHETAPAPTAPAQSQTSVSVFGQRSHRIGRRKRAKRRQPQRACAAPLPCRRRAPCGRTKSASSKQPGQLQRNLHAGRRSVVFHAEEPETERQKQRITGQPDQRGMQLAASAVQRITAVEQQILRQPAVDQRIPIDLKELRASTAAMPGRRQAPATIETVRRAPPGAGNIRLPVPSIDSQGQLPYDSYCIA